MKTTKLMCAALALVAFAACNKQEVDTVLTSGKKAIQISIENSILETKAVVPTEAANVAVTGGAAIDQAQAVAGAAATANELDFLFANAAGNIVEVHTIADATQNADGSYRWHAVDQAVTQVAVVRTSENPAVGEALSKYRDAAADETTALNKPLAEIALYGASDLTAQGTCTVETDNHEADVTYNLYTATVNVAPLFARLEITGIKCSDLGNANYSAAYENTTTVGLDKLVLGNLTWGTDSKYTLDLEDAELTGSYNQTEEQQTITDCTPENGAWAWNFSIASAFPTDNTPMLLTMTASALDYTVQVTDRTLTINGLNGAIAWEAGKIYRMAINFTEDNLDEVNEAICVEVKVEIAAWVVIEVTPTFAN